MLNLKIKSKKRTFIYNYNISKIIRLRIARSNLKNELIIRSCVYIKVGMSTEKSIFYKLRIYAMNWLPSQYDKM